MDTIYVTAEKRDELIAELHNRVNVMRPEISSRVADARALGDLGENAEYHSSRDEQAKNESRIEELEETLKRIVILKSKSHDIAELSATVTLQKGDSTTEIVYVLASVTEADITQGKLSIESPIGKLLLGKRAGDTFEHQTPGGTVKYTILRVE